MPVIIGGMVLLTYTFVTSLDPAEGPVETDTTAGDPPFPTTATSSAIRLPVQFEAFLVTLDVFESQAKAFGDEAARINDDWEARDVTFNGAISAFNQLKSNIELWEAEVSDATSVPTELAATHVDLVLASEDLAFGVEDIVLGLRAPDDGTLRRTAVTKFATEVQQVVDAIQAIRDAAAAASTGETTDDTTDTTDTTEGTDA